MLYKVHDRRDIASRTSGMDTISIAVFVMHVLSILNLKVCISECMKLENKRNICCFSAACFLSATLLFLAEWFFVKEVLGHNFGWGSWKKSEHRHTYRNAFSYYTGASGEFRGLICNRVTVNIVLYIVSLLQVFVEESMKYIALLASTLFYAVKILSRQIC